MMPGVPPTRRGGGGARREVSKRVSFLEGEREITGWALNVSRGGLRAIVEDKVELGAEFKIAIGDDEVRRLGRIVWIQDEPDGSIVGVSFLDDPPPSVGSWRDSQLDSAELAPPASASAALREPDPSSTKSPVCAEDDAPKRSPVRPEPPPEG